MKQPSQIAARDVTPGMTVRHPKHGRFLVRQAVTQDDKTTLTAWDGGYFYYWPDTELELLANNNEETRS